MSKARMLGMKTGYTPNNKDDLRYRKKLHKNEPTPPKIITSVRLTQVSLVPDAEPYCRINRGKET